MEDRYSVKFEKEIPVVSPSTMGPVNESSKTNLARCEDILECRRQINDWTSRLEILEAEQTRRIKMARLRLDARTTWRTLSKKEKLDKEFIVAAMQSPDLPTILEKYPNSVFPPQIRLDRDILLARVAREDFQSRHSEDRLFIPPLLRGDRAVILAIIPKHPQVVECMCHSLRDDVEVFEAILKNSTFPNHFLQHFSERIRSSPTLMLRVLKHPTGLPSLAYVSQCLRNKKEFLLQVIEEASHGTTLLKYVSHQLRAEKDVVLAAVRKSGMNLKHAAYSLRRDSSVVLAACAQNGGAFKYCLPGQLRETLIEDRSFVLNVLQTAPRSLARDCVARFKNDHEVVLEAVGNGLEWCDVPCELQQDGGFVKQAIRRKSSLYMEISEDFKDNRDVAFEALLAHEVQDNVILEATDRIPELLGDRAAMMAVAKNWQSDVFQETLQFSPDHIRSDKEIMIEAVQNDSIAFEYCSDELQQDLDVVKAAIEAYPASLYLVPDNVQLENPDIVIMAIGRTDPEELWATYDDVYEELWTNRDVVKAWLSAGGEWMEDQFPDEFSQDEEFLLVVAEHNYSEFDYADDSLKSNKEFMLQAVAKDGRVFKDASCDLRHDCDLALAAFGSSQEAIHYFSGKDDFEFMVSFSTGINERLAEYDVFTTEVLGAIARPAMNGCQCILPMLNQGEETTSSYKQSLAGYLGLPEAPELHLLREASRNLLRWGF
jgi:hypothetical protein